MEIIYCQFFALQKFRFIDISNPETMILSVIVPCYNEFSRFPTVMFDDFIRTNIDVEFCFVNDGSSDDTGNMLELLRQNHAGNVTVLHLHVNCGKGEAVRKGINYMLKNSPSTYLAYIDADLSTPLKEVIRIFDMMKEQQLLFVFGSRVSVFGSQIHRLNYRHYGGRIIATIIDMVFHLSIYDTQCGLKIFHNTLAPEVFKRPFLSRWLFDVEIFAIMKDIYSTDDLTDIMKEIPINEWNEMGDSKVRFMDIVKIPFALLNIKKKYGSRKLHKYNMQSPPDKVLSSFISSNLKQS